MTNNTQQTPQKNLNTDPLEAAAQKALQPTYTLEAKGLKKRYGSRWVVKDVSLSVKSGEVVGLLGPNGAGKTTTFNMVVGLIVADGGTIELNGQSIAHLPIYKRSRLGVSYLPQEASVFRRMTVEENIRAILELQTDENGKAYSSGVIDQKLDELLDELQIARLRTNTAMSLSGGVYKRQCPEVNDAVRKLHERSQRSRSLFCLTNLSPVWIRLPSLKSNALSDF